MKFQFYLYFVAEMSIANRFISKHVKRQIFLKKYIEFSVETTAPKIKRIVW